ncbi:MAG: UDP-3-O-(3-hydroxymyristoyl)glucosamine N-acyltransferase [Flavobacteriaceae bacterium]|nr:UDP-3-O-(3-hydroxymyristoyl)glucosamine N-acyltransferase [Flavobacteriaceae bacterium]|tara:strand:+ start:2796 stop:3809 length:1014 start_codon:yes stop_codon:yes gene_type:complete
MKFTAEQIAKKVNGNIEGNSKVELFALSKIEEAKQGSITFLSNPKYIPFIYKTKASAVIVDNNFIPENKLETTLIRVKDAYSSFTKILELFNMEGDKLYEIDKSALVNKTIKIPKKIFVGALTIIEKGVVLSENIQIKAQCYIGENVKIGKNTIIQNGVKILSNSIIGNNCIVNAGAVIGCDGFGFAPQENGTYAKIPQTGNVVIGNNVEIGSNSTIDRATMGSTIIHDGVKIDNLVQIAHNAEIGKNTVFAGQSGVSGSTKIGENCVIGGQAGIAGHLKIGNNVRIQGQTGVLRDIPDNKQIQGTPAIEFNDYYRSYAYFKKLPDFENRLKKIEKK